MTHLLVGGITMLKFLRVSSQRGSLMIVAAASDAGSAGRNRTDVVLCAVAVGSRQIRPSVARPKTLIGKEPWELNRVSIR